MKEAGLHGFHGDHAARNAVKEFNIASAGVTTQQISTVPGGRLMSDHAENKKIAGVSISNFFPSLFFFFFFFFFFWFLLFLVLFLLI